MIASTLSRICHWTPASVADPRRVSPHEPTAPVSDADEPAWETECIRRTQGGHPDAFNPLVARYAPRIRAYLHRMLRNREEAEDLTQETFIKAFRAIHRFDAERPFKSWLYTIATNTGLNALRGQKRRGTQVALDPELPAHAEAGHRCGGESREKLESAMAALSPRAAQLITLHYHEGFSLLEAGQVLGMSEGAAKAALCRARQELRTTMLNEVRE
ncbi:MAG: RNA polymerase sigma factor [Candidatus Hydrogenedentes bacterium]|nr:RNA polymerase sigma factor [Candidatus Hydrogenedentota bacterium]